MNREARRVAIIGGLRIPFCRAHTAYAEQSNQDMLTAVLKGMVDKYQLHGERLGDVSLGAVIMLLTLSWLAWRTVNPDEFDIDDAT